MSLQSNLLKIIAVMVLAGGAGIQAQPRANEPGDPALAGLGKIFSSHTAKVNGTMLFYLRGGEGPPLILLHGFPQDWYEFHQVMPRLARRFTVVAVDLRGIGRSAVPAGGYDAANVAEDIHQLLQQLKLDRVYLAGHDLGGLVTYAFARLYAKETRGVMLIDVPVIGLDPWRELKCDPHLWHVGFFQTPGMPEKLLSGQLNTFFREFFNGGLLNAKTISNADVARYARSYAPPDHLRAGMEFYRAFPADEKFNAEQKSPIDLPIVLAGSEYVFGKINPKVAETLRAHGWTRVTVETIKNSSHYVVDEQPEVIAELIERYASP